MDHKNIILNERSQTQKNIDYMILCMTPWIKQRQGVAAAEDRGKGGFIKKGTIKFSGEMKIFSIFFR